MSALAGTDPSASCKVRIQQFRTLRTSCCNLAYSPAAWRVLLADSISGKSSFPVSLRTGSFIISGRRRQRYTALAQYWRSAHEDLAVEADIARATIVKTLYSQGLFRQPPASLSFFERTSCSTLTSAMRLSIRDLARSRASLAWAWRLIFRHALP